MKLIRRIAAMSFAGSTLAALVVGALTLTSKPAHAFPAVLLCGPSILWVCSGADADDVLFGGTVCEAARFTRKTGLTCVPYGG